MGSHSFSSSHPGPGSYRGLQSGPLGGGARHWPGNHGFGGGHPRDRHIGFRNRWAYGYPYYGYPYYGYYDPYWWWDSGSSYDDGQAQEQQIANEMNEENLEEQQMLEQRDQDAYARPRAPRGLEPARQETVRNDPATVLVFRNGSRREIQNYAIVDGMLFNFTLARAEKIPLAVLDIPATVKANDDRGLDFRLPGTGEGQ